MKIRIIIGNEYKICSRLNIRSPGKAANHDLVLQTALIETPKASMDVFFFQTRFSLLLADRHGTCKLPVPVFVAFRTLILRKTFRGYALLELV